MSKSKSSLAYRGFLKGATAGAAAFVAQTSVAMAQQVGATVAAAPAAVSSNQRPGADFMLDVILDHGAGREGRAVCRLGCGQGGRPVLSRRPDRGVCLGRNRRDEVYVRSVANPGEAVPVSAEGGNEPAWAPGGKELFYRRGDAFTQLDRDVVVRVLPASNSCLTFTASATPCTPRYPSCRRSSGWRPPVSSARSMFLCGTLAACRTSVASSSWANDRQVRAPALNL